MMTDAADLPIMHWIWLTILTGIVSNIGWELFNYFGHAAAHSLASAWHELKRLPSHVFSLHAPLRVAGVVLAALAVISLAQATGGYTFAAALMSLIEFYRGFAHAVGDWAFAFIINPDTRHVAYDLIVVALIFVFIIWRTASGWRGYAEFQASHAQEGALSFGAYFGLHLLGGLGAIVLALAVMNRLI
jgi:hypothetical protein